MSGLAMLKPLIVLAVALVVAFAPATAADQPVRTEYLLFHGTVLLNDLC